MRSLGVIALFCVLFLSSGAGVYALDNAPAKPAEKPVVAVADDKEKIEQHAPTIDVGDTRRFAASGPLSASKEEEEWYQYY